MKKNKNETQNKKQATLVSGMAGSRLKITVRTLPFHLKDRLSTSGAPTDSHPLSLAI